ASPPSTRKAWRRRCARPPTARSSATWCCSHPPARPSTLSRTTSTGARCSRTSYAGSSRRGPADAAQGGTGRVAVRRGDGPGLPRRGNGVLGERHRGGRPVRRSLLLPQEAALLGRPRRRPPLGRPASGLPPARAPRDPAARDLVRAPHPRAGPAVRPIHQRHAALVPHRAALVPAGGAGQVLPRALLGVVPHQAARGDPDVLAGPLPPPPRGWDDGGA